MPACVGDQVADRGLRVQGIALSSSTTWWRRPSRRARPEFATTAATSGSGVTVAVSMTRNCGHQVVTRRPSCCFTSMVISIAVT
jgi:hypothetical protein